MGLYFLPWFATAAAPAAAASGSRYAPGLVGTKLSSSSQLRLTVDATLASRYHERFADHAVSIAKKVQYLATGDWIPAEA